MEEPVEKDQPNQVVGNLKQDLLNIQANQDKIRTKYYHQLLDSFPFNDIVSLSQ